MDTTDLLRILRIAALAAIAAGMLVSEGFTLYAGRNNSSLVLPALFVLWVAAPFIAIAAANTRIKQAPSPLRKRVYKLTIAAALAAATGYSGIFSPANLKPAAIFLFIPVLMWLGIAVSYLVLRRR